MISIKFASINYTQFDRKGIRSAMGKASRLVAKQLKATINKRGTVSAPGEPPARQSGGLLRSVKGRASRRGYALVVSAIAPHAHPLEGGYKHAAARPYFAPTFAGQADAIQSLLRDAIDQGITVTSGAPGSAPRAVEIN
jgi:hypothetical protein